mgnify:CR=1 FL=1
MSWIKCSDEMPEDKYTCLLFCKYTFDDGEETTRIAIGYIEDGYVWIDYDQDGLTELSEVTHWQPLPSPPL